MPYMSLFFDTIIKNGKTKINLKSISSSDRTLRVDRFARASNRSQATNAKANSGSDSSSEASPFFFLRNVGKTRSTRSHGRFQADWSLGFEEK